MTGSTLAHVRGGATEAILNREPCLTPRAAPKPTGYTMGVLYTVKSMVKVVQGWCHNVVKSLARSRSLLTVVGGPMRHVGCTHS